MVKDESDIWKLLGDHRCSLQLMWKDVKIKTEAVLPQQPDSIQPILISQVVVVINKSDVFPGRGVVQHLSYSNKFPFFFMACQYLVGTRTGQVTVGYNGMGITLFVSTFDFGQPPEECEGT